MRKFFVFLVFMLVPVGVFSQTQKLSNVPLEGAHSNITATFYDIDGNKVGPYNVEYWVNDVRTGEVLISKRTPQRVKTASPTPTAIGASPTPTFGFNSSVVFELNTCASRMLTTNQDKEAKRLNVTFQYASGKTGTAQAEWNVEQMPNLNVVSIPSPGAATPECVNVVAPTPTPTATPES